MNHLLFVAAAGFFAASSAYAQAPEINASAKAMVGAWELSDATRDKICAVTFSRTAVKVGHRVTFAPACAALFPLVEHVAAWRYPDNDLLYWLDAKGNALVQFSEVEDSIFEAPTPGVGVLFLHNPALTDPGDNRESRGPDSLPDDERREPSETPAPKNAPESALKGNGG